VKTQRGREKKQKKYKGRRRDDDGREVKVCRARDGVIAAVNLREKKKKPIAFPHHHI
jgi:hypothetical protein